MSKAWTKIGKQDFSDTTTFLATDLTSYAKMISLWVYFIFATTFCTGFTQTEKKYVKVIDDGIYNRIIKYKAKNEIIKISRNYSNVDKKNMESFKMNSFAGIFKVFC